MKISSDLVESCQIETFQKLFNHSVHSCIACYNILMHGLFGLSAHPSSHSHRDREGRRPLALRLLCSAMALTCSLILSTRPSMNRSRFSLFVSNRFASSVSASFRNFSSSAPRRLAASTNFSSLFALSTFCASND